ncbi:MAG: hypothetical protein P8X42_14515, partial [Calditrichaceae bacterium]
KCAPDASNCSNGKVGIFLLLLIGLCLHQSLSISIRQPPDTRRWERMMCELISIILYKKSQIIFWLGNI